LQGTLSDYKNELLFTEFGINYNALPDRLRKVRSKAYGFGSKQKQAIIGAAKQAGDTAVVISCQQY
jgi:tRNA(His) 5'-end guanylyltransferase